MQHKATFNVYFFILLLQCEQILHEMVSNQLDCEAFQSASHPNPTINFAKPRHKNMPCIIAQFIIHRDVIPVARNLKELKIAYKNNGNLPMQK